MSKPRVTLIFNIAPHYREAIYKRMESEWNCKWYFGKNEGDIPALPASTLSEMVEVKMHHGPGNTLWLPGVAHKVMTDSDTEQIIMLGEIKFLTSWSILLRNLLRSKNKKIKVHLWSHGWTGSYSPMLSKGVAGWMKRKAYKIYFSLADTLFLYGETSRRIALSEGIKDDKICVVHNSLDYAVQKMVRDSLRRDDVYKETFGNDAPVALFIGRVTDVKRLDIMLRALKMLKDDGINLNFAVAGSGKAVASLKSLSEELGVADRVAWLGACYNEERNGHLLYNADICVSPGNVGLTAIHSLAYGTPVITSNDSLRQMPEYEAIAYSTKCGALFQAGDAADLASTIRKWLEQGMEREEIRQTCIKEIEQRWTPEYQFSRFSTRIK